MKEIFTEWVPLMLSGCGLTVKLFFIVIVLSIPLGLIITFLYSGSISGKEKSKAKLEKKKSPVNYLLYAKDIIVNYILGLYILIMRGTPLLLQIFFIYFGLPFMPVVGKYLTISDRFTAGAVAYVLNYAAYYAEIFRGGLLSVDKGQYEAAKVLGLSERQTTFKIVLPQMIRISLPAVSNEAIILIKDTALITTIGLVDLLKVTNSIVNRTTNISAFIVAGIFYLAMSYVLTLFFKYLEKKFAF
ncbi:MAG: amino acid ABC transporter permease [Clostridiales bacterium]|nr:amino acid ABC transporter permease [Clostridiales bacterium]